MAENSKIEWCDHTFNPWIGCQKVSSACDNCYAETWDQRFKGERWGPYAKRTLTVKSNWYKPLKWNREAINDGVRKKVFCASLADVFDNHRSILPGWRKDLWELIKATPALDWLLLTKRPQNIEKYLPDDWGNHGYPNVWLGTTVEDQFEAERRIPILLETPAPIHFLSCEPLLGPVDFARTLNMTTDKIPEGDSFPINPYKTLNWVICGGETGKEARPMNPQWVVNLRDQCIYHRIPFFFKQWGEWAPYRFCKKSCLDSLQYRCNVSARTSILYDEFVYKIGKKNTRNELITGVSHEFPLTKRNNNHD